GALWAETDEARAGRGGVAGGGTRAGAEAAGRRD
ncbi:hypothetical protein GA0115252_12332, partial [Streptomyces sp. DfronAA-171]